MDDFNNQQMNNYNQQQYQQPQQFQPQYQQPMYQQQQKNPTLVRDVVLSVIQVVIMGSLFTGVISLVFALMANDRFTIGDYIKYENYTRYGRIARIVGYVLFGLAIILFFLFILGLSYTFVEYG